MYSDTVHYNKLRPNKRSAGKNTIQPLRPIVKINDELKVKDSSVISEKKSNKQK